MSAARSASEPPVLGLVHTMPPLVDVFTKLAGELLLGVRLLHILDQPLLVHVTERGSASREDVERLEGHVRALAGVGADVVLVTCSSLSPYVERFQASLPVPVVRIDTAMIARAVAVGRRVGVVATVGSALAATRQMLMAEAARTGREIFVEETLAEGGLACLLAGDGAQHDLLAKQAILRLSDQVDVLVLAQASMDRALAALLDGEIKAKVLTSPRSALAEVGRLLARTGGDST